jgi:hypothetical protein
MLVVVAVDYTPLVQTVQPLMVVVLEKVQTQMEMLELMEEVVEEVVLEELAHTSAVMEALVSSLSAIKQTVLTEYLLLQLVVQ